MNLQPVYDIAEICARHNVTNVVLSPGSRCAPITIAFARHSKMQVKTVPDERAASFISLGMAQVTKKASVLVCTSGTASLNYAPAIAEAFYQHIPLLILTADRPPEWVNQQDGQTIEQFQIYGKHVKASYNFPSDLDNSDAQWHSHRMVSEAINEAHAFPPGPVHINIPLREPFYPNKGEQITYSHDLKVIKQTNFDYLINPEKLSYLHEELQQYSKIIVIAGQHAFDSELLQALSAFQKSYNCVLVGDVISNIFSFPTAISHQDIFLGANEEKALEALKPELLITFGNSIISKSLKLFLRKYKPVVHWHLQIAGPVADTYQTLTDVIRCLPKLFFQSLITENIPFKQNEYFNLWEIANKKAGNFIQNYFAGKEFTEFLAYATLLKALPQNSLLHLANSMAVRYVNILGISSDNNIEVFANRGTSGIDGSTSTSVGSALNTDKLVTLLTGDMAFFYDRNALWHNYLPSNLRIIIFNNQGGGIFRLIDGPRNQPELDEYFETKQTLTAANTARDFQLIYYPCSSLSDIENALPKFWQSGPGILEIFSSSASNAEFFTQYKKSSPFLESN